MRIRVVLLIVIMCLTCISIKAQKKHNIIFAASPYGHVHISMSKEDEKYKYDYKNFINGGFQYENSHNGITSLTELNYFKADYEKMDLKEVQTTYFNPNCTENVFGATLTQYIGVVINHKRSVQLPIYFGLGADYLNNRDFLHHFTGDLAAKARLKFHFNNLGFYIGGGARMGFGVKGGSEHEGYHILTTLWNVDCGFILGL